MYFHFPEGELGTWACLGAVTDRSVRVWLREAQARPSLATLRVDGQVRAQRLLEPAADADGIAAGDLTLESPAPGMPFAIEVVGMTRSGTFAPPPDQPGHFTFAFGSCHQPFRRPEGNQLVVHPGAGIYPAMEAEFIERDVRFLLLLGDQIYSDGAQPLHIRHDMRHRANWPAHDEIVGIYRHIYRGYFQQSGFRSLLERYPSYMIWDDHDIFDGWGSLSDTDAYDRQIFQAAAQTFSEYQHLHNPNTTLGDQPPFHTSFWYADTGFFVFDLRGERAYDKGILITERQWRDFRQFLNEATARHCSTIFIVASIPVIHFSPLMTVLMSGLPTELGNDIRDRWSSAPFEPEREALLESLFAWERAHPHRQAIILSGDVHAGAAFRATAREGPGIIRQWTSSPFTTPTGIGHHLVNWLGSSLVNLGERALRIEREAIVFGNNFGVVEVSPLPTGGHSVEYTLYNYLHDSGTIRPATRVTARPAAP